MHVAWEAIETFLAVAEESSFSGAAKKLSVTQPTVSRRVAALEEQLGRKLFRRDAEGAQLSEDGAKLLSAAVAMARHADEFQTMGEHFEERVEGLVALSAPRMETHHFLVPFARQLRRQHPALQLELVSDATETAIARGEIAVAFLERAPLDKELQVLARLCVPKKVFSAPCYPGRERTSLDELEWIAFPQARRHREPNATLTRLLGRFSPAIALDDEVLQLAALSSGLGAMVLPALFFENSPYALIPLEHDWGKKELYLVVSDAMKCLARVRAVSDALLQTLSGDSSIEVG